MDKNMWLSHMNEDRFEEFQELKQQQSDRRKVLNEALKNISDESIIPILSQVHAIFILKDDDDAHVTSGQKMSDDTTFGKSHIASLSRQPPKPKMATVDRSVSPDSVNPSFQQKILAEIS
ncbi:unnamed protein product [Rotaria magnacalcarata]|uniref:Uncharacterized protein n=1 Tax=Rotaria magnacalcarata TaxID=392030 RepID=A0A8S2MLH5_9BILA|nr:unnamed protein product [Rotaria magnacalcarata]